MRICKSSADKRRKSMKKTILQESDAGIIYRIDKIPSSMSDEK